MKIFDKQAKQHEFYIRNQKFIVIEWDFDYFEVFADYGGSYYTLVDVCKSMSDCKEMAEIYMGEYH